jgi:hypothetical protein
MTQEPYARIIERPNPQVFQAAVEFHDAAKLLWGSEPRGPRQPHFVVTVVVNAAFALELYLKSLSTDHVFYDPQETEAGVRIFARIFDEPRTRSHRLLDLFDGLDAYLREHLSSAYLRSNLTREFPTMREAVQAYNQTFKQWRYLYEDHNFGRGLNLKQDAVNRLVAPSFPNGIHNTADQPVADVG